jgi:hypothetical protein
VRALKALMDRRAALSSSAGSGDASGHHDGCHGGGLAGLASDGLTDASCVLSRLLTRQALLTQSCACRFTTAPRGDLLARLRGGEASALRLRAYVDQLLAEVLRQSDTLVAAILNGLPRVQQGAAAVDDAAVAQLPDDELRALCRAKAADTAALEAYVNQVCDRVCLGVPCASLLRRSRVSCWRASASTARPSSR